MWPLKTILYFTFFWGVSFASLMNPMWGVVNYMIAYQTNPAGTWWGRPLANLGIRFSLLAAVFTLLGLVIGRKHVPKLKPRLSLFETGVLALVAIAALNLIVGVSYNKDSVHSFEKLWKMMLFVLIIGRLATTRTNLRLLIWTLVVGSAYVGYDAYTSPASSFYLGRLELVGGPDFSSTSGLAAHLTAMLPIIGAAFLISRNWKYRAVAAVAGALSINAIILCRTRSAFIGLACGAIAAVLAAPRARRYRIHFLLVIGALLAFSLTDTHFWDRMATLTSREVLAGDAAAVSRADIWRASLRMIADYPLGVGPGNFQHVISSYESRYYKRSTHNTLLVCFTELGIHGGMVFLALAAVSLRSLYFSARLARHTNRPVETHLLAYGFLVAYVTYFITGLGTERFYCESFWWVMVLPQCLHRVVLAEIEANAQLDLCEPTLVDIEPAPFFGEAQHAY